jgi:flagellar motor switch protein FliN/FliY
MSHEDIARLTSWILNAKAKTRALSSEILQEGFYRYLLLEALDAAQGLPALNELTLHSNEESSLPEQNAFCINIEIAIDQRSCWGRLVIPPDFRTSWVNHFSKIPLDYLSSNLARETHLILGVKVGSILIKRNEWKKIKKGDFLVLDPGGYNPKQETGVASLTLGSTPLFNLKIQQNKIELIDYSFYYEDTMEQKGPGNGYYPDEPAESSENQPQPAEGEVTAIKELPLFVTVELARLKMTLDKLMHLNPGNMLELPIHPEQGVSLTVNGQIVGRAELIYLGETLGLRILEIG